MTGDAEVKQNYEPKLSRTIVAIFVGYGVMVIAIKLMYAAAGKLPETSPVGFRIFNIVFDMLRGALGGYVAAAISRYRPIAHALSLAGIALVLGLISVTMAWPVEPHWFLIASLGLLIVGILGGAYARVLRGRDGSGLYARPGA